MKYSLAEVLLLCLLAVLAGADRVADIARFGEKKRDLLRRFRPFTDGTSSYDHLGDILASLDATAFQRCFVAWTGALTGVDPDVIAIDGKTLRRSYQTKGDSAPIHMVSAFAARQRLVLGQVKVADKSNEISAIPKLLARPHRDADHHRHPSGRLARRPSLARTEKHRRGRRSA